MRLASAVIAVAAPAIIAQWNGAVTRRKEVEVTGLPAYRARQGAPVSQSANQSLSRAEASLMRAHNPPPPAP
jgi:hypothetical protein|eukprot:COSAG01_NODE_17070_length_1181_cov_1.252311_1_plen_72_part_00